MKTGAAGVLFLCRKTNRVLLAQRSEHCDLPLTWASFGGGIDAGETSDQAARREVSEEAGYHADYNLIPLYQYRTASFTYTNYLALVDHEWNPMTNYETAASDWFALDELPDRLHPGFKLCLENAYAQRVIRKNLTKEEALTETLEPEDHMKDVIDPATLTFREYFNLVGGEDKSHPDSAYNVSLADKSWVKIEDFETQIKRIKVRGLWFDIKMQKRKNSYARRAENQSDPWLRDESGNILYFTDEEVVAMGRPLYEHTLAMFNEDKQCVASFQDEWGCVLIQVASEYRGFGFGPLLNKMGRSIYPNKTSGGFTPSGARNLRRTHLLFVNQAMRSGFYNMMVRTNQMSAGRAKEIIGSAKASGYDEYAERGANLGMNDPANWVLFFDNHGTFILYDKNLKELINDEGRDEHFIENAFKGMIYVAPGEKYGITFAYGGEHKQVRGFLLKCAASFCADEDVMFVVDKEDLDDVPEGLEVIGNPHLESGFWRANVELTGAPINYKAMGRAEAQWRESFDEYEEFKHRLMEMAYSKYRPNR